MSGDGELYRVLYIDRDGHEHLTQPAPREAAEIQARDLDGQGFAVGSVMTANAAEDYWQNRYASTYRGVKVPDGLRDDGVAHSVYREWKRGVDSVLDGAGEKPKPVDTDLSMSREVADFILRHLAGMREDGSRPVPYTGYSPHDVSRQAYDSALVLRAADIVGREKVRNRELRDFLTYLDASAKDGAS